MLDRGRTRAEILRRFAAAYEVIGATQRRAQLLLGEPGIHHEVEEQRIFEQRVETFATDWTRCNAEIAVLLAEIYDLLADRPEPDAWEP